MGSSQFWKLETGDRELLRVPPRDLSRNHAIEGGDRFTRRRGDAEKGQLEGKLVSHRWVTGCRRWIIVVTGLALRALRGSA